MGSLVHQIKQGLIKREGWGWHSGSRRGNREVNFDARGLECMNLLTRHGGVIFWMEKFQEMIFLNRHPFL